MDVPWKVIGAFVTVFIAGAVFGGVFTLGTSARRFANQQPRNAQAERPLTQLPPANQPRPKVAGPQAPGGQVAARQNPIQPQLMRQFTQKLNLTPEQRKTIVPVVARASEDFQRLRQENLADTARVTERMYADVSALLTLEQRAALAEMRKETQERVETERKKRLEAAAAAAKANASAVEGANPPAAIPLPRSEQR